ncbi:MAG: hypothetical protein P4L40_14095 [Terracidiphilus sp.]|nr:hypothetical protein [Terracidiphilus sp.]
MRSPLHCRDAVCDVCVCVCVLCAHAFPCRPRALVGAECCVRPSPTQHTVIVAIPPPYAEGALRLSQQVSEVLYRGVDTQADAVAGLVFGGAESLYFSEVWDILSPFIADKAAEVDAMVQASGQPWGIPDAEVNTAAAEYLAELGAQGQLEGLNEDQFVSFLLRKSLLPAHPWASDPAVLAQIQALDTQLGAVTGVPLSSFVTPLLANLQGAFLNRSFNADSAYHLLTYRLDINRDERVSNAEFNNFIVSAHCLPVPACVCMCASMFVCVCASVRMCLSDCLSACLPLVSPPVAACMCVYVFVLLPQAVFEPLTLSNGHTSTLQRLKTSFSAVCVLMSSAWDEYVDDQGAPDSLWQSDLSMGISNTAELAMKAFNDGVDILRVAVLEPVVTAVVGMAATVLDADSNGAVSVKEFNQGISSAMGGPQ